MKAGILICTCLNNDDYDLLWIGIVLHVGTVALPKIALPSGHRWTAHQEGLLEYP